MERSVKKGIKWQIAVALLLCALLLLASFAIFTSERALADVDEVVDQTLTVSNSVVHRGEEFNVDISIAHNETGMHAMRLFVTYDNTVLTLVGYEAKNPEGYNWKGNSKAANTDILGGYSTYGTANKPFVLLWDSTSKMYGDGVIVTLTFASDPNAEVDPVTKKSDYEITVAVDAPNTMMTYGKTCSPAVSGGAVEMHYGVYRVELVDANGDYYYHLEDNNNPSISIQDVLDEKGTGVPQKAETAQYTYEFVSWREIDSSVDGKQVVYKPTYKANPKSYRLTFRQGIKLQDTDVVDYGDNDAAVYATISEYLGAGYQYRNASTDPIQFGTIIVFDDYKPTVDYARHPDYTFRGWFTDEDCTEPASFATMPAENKTLYGYYAYTADPDDVTTTKFGVTTEVAGNYAIATLSVTENFGFNTLRFALDYDQTVLDFVGFYYPSDTDLYAELAPTFPAINAKTAAGGAVEDEWQTLEQGYTIAGKRFVFENKVGNAYSSAAVSATGELILFKFEFKEGIAADSTEIGITIDERDLTRYVGDGSTWYANATIDEGAIDIVRVASPTPKDKTYTYTGDEITFEFESIDLTHCAVTKNVRTDSGTYNGSEAVTVSLVPITSTYVTWTDGTIEDKTFPFTIGVKQVAKPVEYGGTFTYDGTEKTYPVAVSADYYVKNLENSETPSNKRTLAGVQTVSVALNDSDNTEWADGTTADVTFTFRIYPKAVTKPTASSATYTYLDGANVEYVFDNSGDSGEYNAYNTIRVNAGNYNAEIPDAETEAVRVTLKDAENTVWKDADPGEETATLYFPFLIAKKALPSPSVDPKEYTGALLTADVAEDARYTVLNEGGVDKGDYPVVFTFTQEARKNYAWENSATDALTVLFSIVDVANEWTTEPAVWDKTYDGAPITAYTAAAKYGEVVVTFRAQNPAPNEEYVATAPTNAGLYYARFTVAESVSYNGLTRTLPFEIRKLALTAPTETTKTYVYTGAEQTYEFANAGDTEQYDLAGARRTDAGSQYVTASIHDKTNYKWADETIADKVFLFTIAKKQLTIPRSAGRIYLYNGNEQDFAFSVAGDTDSYDLFGATQTEVGEHEVVVHIKNNANYEWTDGTTGDKTYLFSIRYPSLTATTGGDSPITVTITTAAGFVKNTVFNVIKGEVNLADLVASLAAKEKVGAMGDLTPAEAAALAGGKCVAASLNLTLSPANAESYLIEITLPAARGGLAAGRISGNTVEVFRATTSEDGLSFLSDAAGSILILAEHVFDEEVANETYLKSGATCEEQAVYYKSCACGLSSRDFGGETFRYGEPLGHDYDLDHITWIWGANHATATARVVCKRDETHVLELPAEINITKVPPKAEESGYADYVASITWEGTLYESDPYREILPATGHDYVVQKPWIWKETAGKYSAKAVFACECGEIVTPDATVTYQVGEKTIVYTALVVFEGAIYTDDLTIDRPVAIFLHNDGTENQDDLKLIPGEQIVFFDLPARSGFTFVGWRSENGTLIAKANGVYPEYRIGLEKVVFTAEWLSHAEVNVSVRDTADDPIAGATVKLYENDTLVRSVNTNAYGAATFDAVPYGNYKLVVEYPYVGNVMITRSDGLDVDQPTIEVSLVLPRSNFNTVVEGDGSSEGLENVITDDEKNGISDGTAGGTINEIVITQRRVQSVSDEIKEEITEALLKDQPATKSTFVDFYDITIVKTTTARNGSGVQYVREEYIKEAAMFQTNIFPLTASMRAELIKVEGSSANIFVYKRHTYDTGVVTIEPLPKVSEKEGKNADFECFYIKVVSGVEYIAIRQKEYSVLAFGASPDPILLANEILTLEVNDTVYGTALGDPTSTARYGASTVVYIYAAEKDGEYVAEKPTAAGTYYLKAFVPASADYSAAQKVVEFKIARKVIARPTADATRYEYTGAEQVYGITSNADYTVGNGRQTNAGKYVVTVSLKDVANTVWDSGLDSPLTYDFVIEKKKLSDVGQITFEDKSFWFTGKRRSIEVSGDLPEGVTVDYVGNDQADLGKYEVKAVFHSANPNYDVSEPMIAYMTIRMNWTPIVILIAVVFAILVTAIVLVERLLKKLKQGPPPEQPNGQNGGDKAKEEGNND